MATPSVEEQDPVLETLHDLARNDSEIAVLWLYGSRAKGNSTPENHYDLAVAFAEPFTDPLERRLRPELLAQRWQDVFGGAGRQSLSH